MMNAASEEHHAGRKGNSIHTASLKINLQTEKQESSHLDIKKISSFFKPSKLLHTTFKCCCSCFRGSWKIRSFTLYSTTSLSLCCVTYLNIFIDISIRKNY